MNANTKKRTRTHFFFFSIYAYHGVYDVAGVRLGVVFADAHEAQAALGGGQRVYHSIGEAVKRVGGECWACRNGTHNKGRGKRRSM